MDLSVTATHDTASKRSRKDDEEDRKASQGLPIAHVHPIDGMMDVVSASDALPEIIPHYNGDPQNNALDLTSHGDEVSTSTECKSIHSEIAIKMNQIKFVRTLNDNPKTKMITYEGQYNQQPVVVVLEKTAVSETAVQAFLETDSPVLVKDFVNDIYGKYHLFTSCPSLSTIRTTIIHPATEKHIQKYMKHDIRLIEETVGDYNSITLPFITQSQLNLDWVYNILDHKNEVERIVFEDPDPETGFILLPDMKWDQINLQDLYLVGIVNTRGIKSLRDLNSTHIPLLNNIFMKGVQAIKSKYGLCQNQLRIYLHYQPSYYHLHVHFTSLSFEAPGSYVERAHLLSTVIQNIELMAGYYQTATLAFPVTVNHDLFQAFSAKKP